MSSPLSTATINGATVTSKTLNSDGTLTVAYAFPATAGVPITSVALTDITAPVKSAVPDTTAATSDTTYTIGTVSWSPMVSSTFAAGTVYTASVTVTPASGYQFTSGTTATVNGATATSVTLNGNDTLTVTYTFPATESELVTLSSVSAAFDQGGTTVYPITALNSLKPMLTVTAHYSDGSTATLVSGDYDLSGTLAAGTSTVTVTYNSKTTTFNVTVTAVTLSGISVTIRRPILPTSRENSLTRQGWSSRLPTITATWYLSLHTPARLRKP